MRHFIIVALMLSLSMDTHAHLNLPPEIIAGLTQSSAGESGGFFVQGVGRDVFIDYITEHWREIADHIEELPKRPGLFRSPEPPTDIPVSNFGSACESLPPLEYLDFMDKFLELYREKRIALRPVQSQLLAGSTKSDFLAVNWEHPRVKAIFDKARILIPPDDEVFLGWMNEAASGALADNYLTNMPDDTPRPETLPGIKLQRPWASLIRRYEAMTGKKLPYDPKYDPRPDRRRSDGSNVSSETLATAPTRNAMRWPLIVVVTLLVAALVACLARKKKPVT